MKILAKTDPGKIRTSNQDSYAAGELNGAPAAFAVVCDGMGGIGGANGGAVASSIAVRSISSRITDNFRPGMNESSIRNLLTGAIINANYEVYDKTKEMDEISEMGTTVVAAIKTPDTIYVAHAGDSRAYLIGDTHIEQITDDHSIVQALVDSGEISKEDARKHPDKNCITRALGMEEELKVDFNVVDVKETDVLLICTDGLTNFVTDTEILSVVRSGIYKDPTEALVELANDHGGADNITVVCIV